jgi:hypothetical protein
VKYDRRDGMKRRRNGLKNEKAVLEGAIPFPRTAFCKE